MTYHRPEGLDEALAIAAGGAAVVAGCTDLFPATETQRLGGEGRALLDVTGVGALAGIAATAAGVRIGAATRWSDIRDAALPPAFDALRQAAREVGSVQIQNAGTIGGNLCNASPAADGAPPLLALDAAVELASRDGVRSLPLSDFLLGPRRTALRTGEIMTAVIAPGDATTGRSVFLKLGARRHLVISIAMTAVRIETSGGRIVAAAVAVGACSAVAARAPQVEAALQGCPVDDLPDAAAIRPLLDPALDPIADARADADYRREAAAMLVARALRQAAA